MTDDEKRLEFLITQCEQRINMVDTKAAIVGAVLAIFATLFLEFGPTGLLLDFLPPHTEILIGLIFFLALCGTVALVITLRPVNSIKDFFIVRKTKDHKRKGYWLHSLKSVENFKINKVRNKTEALEEMLRELSKRRIQKYLFFRWSMWFMRMSLFLIFSLSIWTMLTYYM